MFKLVAIVALQVDTTLPFKLKCSEFFAISSRIMKMGIIEHKSPGQGQLAKSRKSI